jgi:hypothetical protein
MVQLGETPQQDAKLASGGEASEIAQFPATPWNYIMPICSDIRLEVPIIRTLPIGANIAGFVLRTEGTNIGIGHLSPANF